MVANDRAEVDRRLRLSVLLRVLNWCLSWLGLVRHRHLMGRLHRSRAMSTHRAVRLLVEWVTNDLSGAWCVCYW